MFITSPEKFATWFNNKYQGVYRKISTQDVRDLTACKLIYRFGYYSPPQDGETIRGILQYEQMREQRKQAPPGKENGNTIAPVRCKVCGALLLQQTEGKKGRPKEYCLGCEVSRNTERSRKWRERKRRLENKASPGSALFCIFDGRLPGENT